MDLRFSQFEILTVVGSLFLCLVFVALFVEAPDIQEDIAVEAAAAARQQNLLWAGLEAHGQRLLLTGAAADADARGQAEAAVRAVPGVTTVVNLVSVVGALGGCQNAVDAHLADRPVTFQAGRQELSDGGMAVLDLVAAEIRSCAAAFEVASHTGAEGDAAINLQLSQRRAEVVVRYLVQRGVDAQRLRSVGYGETQPLATNRSDHGRSANQRLEFRIVGEAA